MIRIILLDVDGVLVQPSGYRAALRATVNHFIGPEFDVREELLTELEKRGISSEWDMVPLLVASYWNDLLSRQTISQLPSDVASAALKINCQGGVEVPSYLSIPEFSLVQGQYPAETALHAGHFTALPLDLRRNLLMNTRDIYQSQTMRIFQHFTLGSEKFAQTYKLSPEFETESLLLTDDRSNITNEIRTKLSRSNHSLAVFTSRPSLPPREVDESTVGYAPEAELALELVGLSDTPLIAFGKLEYIASQYALDPATLVKPSAIHALAAVLAAWTGAELSALQAALDWRATDKLNAAFNHLPHSFELVVIEDTMGGIRSVCAAGEILGKAGFHVTVRPLGLTSGSAAKAFAFERAGIPYYENWEKLILELES